MKREKSSEPAMDLNGLRLTVVLKQLIDWLMGWKTDPGQCGVGAFLFRFPAREKLFGLNLAKVMTMILLIHMAFA